MTVDTYQAARDFKFNGRQIQRNDAVKAATINAVDPSKLGTFLRTGFLVLPPGHAVRSMSKPQLVTFAETLGVSVSSSWRKDEILEAVESEM